MAQPPGSAADTAPSPARCFQCGAAVSGTRHTRSGYIVGHYALHTGRTVEATLRRRDDEAPLVYRRLVEAVEMYACPTCFALPEVQARWQAFGDDETGPA